MDSGEVLYDHREVARFEFPEESCHDAHRKCRVECREKLNLHVSISESVPRKSSALSDMPFFLANHQLSETKNPTKLKGGFSALESSVRHQIRRDTWKGNRQLWKMGVWRLTVVYLVSLASSSERINRSACRPMIGNASTRVRSWRIWVISDVQGVSWDSSLIHATPSRQWNEIKRQIVQRGFQLKNKVSPARENGVFSLFWCQNSKIICKGVKNAPRIKRPKSGDASVWV